MKKINNILISSLLILNLNAGTINVANGVYEETATCNPGFFLNTKKGICEKSPDCSSGTLNSEGSACITPIISEGSNIYTLKSENIGNCSIPDEYTYTSSIKDIVLKDKEKSYSYTAPTLATVTADTFIKLDYADKILNTYLNNGYSNLNTGTVADRLNSTIITHTGTTTDYLTATATTALKDNPKYLELTDNPANLSCSSVAKIVLVTNHTFVPGNYVSWDPQVITTMNNDLIKINGTIYQVSNSYYVGDTGSYSSAFGTTITNTVTGQVYNYPTSHNYPERNNGTRFAHHQLSYSSTADSITATITPTPYKNNWCMTTATVTLAKKENTTVYSCPVSEGYSLNGTTCEKTINYNYYEYSCPAGYSPLNPGYTSYSKTDPDSTNNNNLTLSADVNPNTVSDGNCVKNVNYNYYNYTCDAGFLPTNAGLLNYIKYDPNITINNTTELSTTVNSSIPPTNNCVKNIMECPAGYYEVTGKAQACEKSTIVCMDGYTKVNDTTCSKQVQTCTTGILENELCKNVSYSCPFGFQEVTGEIKPCKKEIISCPFSYSLVPNDNTQCRKAKVNFDCKKKYTCEKNLIACEPGSVQAKFYTDTNGIKQICTDTTPANLCSGNDICISKKNPYCEVGYVYNAASNKCEAPAFCEAGYVLQKDGCKRDYTYSIYTCGVGFEGPVDQGFDCLASCGGNQCSCNPATPPANNCKKKFSLGNDPVVITKKRDIVTHIATGSVSPKEYGINKNYACGDNCLDTVTEITGKDNKLCFIKENGKTECITVEGCGFEGTIKTDKTPNDLYDLNVDDQYTLSLSNTNPKPNVVYAEKIAQTKITGVSITGTSIIPSVYHFVGSGNKLTTYYWWGTNPSSKGDTSYLTFNYIESTNSISITDRMWEMNIMDTITDGSNKVSFKNPNSNSGSLTFNIVNNAISITGNASTGLTSFSGNGTNCIQFASGVPICFDLVKTTTYVCPTSEGYTDNGTNCRKELPVAQPIKTKISSTCKMNGHVGWHSRTEGIVSVIVDPVAKDKLKFWDSFKDKDLGYIEFVKDASEQDKKDGYIPENGFLYEMLGAGFTAIDTIENNTFFISAYDQSDAECLANATKKGLVTASITDSMKPTLKYLSGNRFEKQSIDAICYNNGTTLATKTCYCETGVLNTSGKCDVQPKCILVKTGQQRFSDQTKVVKEESRTNPVAYKCSPISCSNNSCQVAYCPTDATGTYQGNIIDPKGTPVVTGECTGQVCDANKDYYEMCGRRSGCDLFNPLIYEDNGVCKELYCNPGYIMDNVTKKCKKLECPIGTAVQADGSCKRI